MNKLKSTKRNITKKQVKKAPSRNVKKSASKKRGGMNSNVLNDYQLLFAMRNFIILQDKVNNSKSFIGIDTINSVRAESDFYDFLYRYYLTFKKIISDAGKFDGNEYQFNDMFILDKDKNIYILSPITSLVRSYSYKAPISNDQFEKIIIDKYNKLEVMTRKLFNKKFPGYNN